MVRSFDIFSVIQERLDVDDFRHIQNIPQVEEKRKHQKFIFYSVC